MKWAAPALLALLILPTSRALAAGDPWTALPPVPQPREAAAAATGADGRIYLIGGTDGYTGAPDFLSVQTVRVDAYDPRSNAWSPAPALPLPRASFAAVGGRDGRIYALGGYTNGDVRLANLDVYDPKTSTWQSLAAMPTARNGLAAAAGPDGRIYAMGGCSFEFNNRCNVLQTLEIYSPTSNSWITGPPMPTARASLAAALGSDGRIYAIGGENESQQALNVVEAYDPASNAWSTAPSMPTVRSLLAATSGSDGRIYAIGGANDGLSANVGAIYGKVEIFDPRSGAWLIGKPMPQASHALAAATGPDGRIYALAGANTFPIILDMAYAYSPAADTPAPPSPAPACQFILGFQNLHDLDSADIGDCLENQHFEPNGDAIQFTVKGMLVWRKADNWTAFTDGYRTWVYGPSGLQQRLNTQRFSWEANPTGLPVVSGSA